VSKDPLFVEKVRDVVGLYLNPPERAVVLCVDEKTQIQALNRTAPVFPMLPGTPARATHDYVRHGTSSLYAALDLTTGQVIGSLHSRHRATEFLAFLKRSTPKSPPTWTATSCSTTPPPQNARGKALADKPSPLRVALHPNQSSWLNLVEVVRRTDHQETAPRHPHLGTPTQRRHPRLDPNLERQPPPLRLDKTPTNPGQHRNYCARINDSGH